RPPRRLPRDRAAPHRFLVRYAPARRGGVPGRGRLPQHQHARRPQGLRTAMKQDTTLAAAIGCLSDYDADALPVASVRSVIERFVSPVEAIERLPLRCALGRVLAGDQSSPIDVPAHDNSAMDGFAFRHADLSPGDRTVLRIVGSALAG